jgi:hypothetical protein
MKPLLDNLLFHHFQPSTIFIETHQWPFSFFFFFLIWKYFTYMFTKHPFYTSTAYMYIHMVRLIKHNEKEKYM